MFEYIEISAEMVGQGPICKALMASLGEVIYFRRDKIDKNN